MRRSEDPFESAAIASSSSSSSPASASPFIRSLRTQASTTQRRLRVRATDVSALRRRLSSAEGSKRPPHPNRPAPTTDAPKRPKHTLLPTPPTMRRSTSGMRTSSSGLRTSSSGAGGRRKLKISLTRTPTSTSCTDMVSQWPKLESAINAIHNSAPVPTTREELYSVVEDLCRHKFGQELYDRVAQHVSAHIAAQAKTLLQRSDDGMPFLEATNTVWNNHCQNMTLICAILSYLDQYNILHAPDNVSLWKMGLRVFRASVLSLTTILNKVTTTVLHLIHRERLGDAIDRSLMHNVVRMFSSLHMYDALEADFLQRTHAFYAAESARVSRERDVPSYLRHTQDRLRQESERCTQYMEDSTRRSVLGAVQYECVHVHASHLIEVGFSTMMSEKRENDLALMYTLYDSVAQLDALQVAFTRHLKAYGVQLLQGGDAAAATSSSPTATATTSHQQAHQRRRDKAVVSNLLQWKDDVEQLWMSAFASNEDFAAGMRNALRHIINVDSNRLAELLAKHVDAQLKSTKITDGALDDTFDKVINVFRFLSAKDIFEGFYKKDLAKRLLHEKCHSVDNEKLMITKLKRECGSSFTGKLESMFKDIDLSREMEDEFNAYVDQHQHEDVDDVVAGADNADGNGVTTDVQPMDTSASATAEGDTTSTASAMTMVSTTPTREGMPNLPLGFRMFTYVLTDSVWPAQKTLEVTLPEHLNRARAKFEAYYLGKNEARKLTWQHSLSSCLLRADFPMGRKELQVSLFQALVLLQFNDTDTLHFEQLQKALSLEEGELCRTLKSLACGKIRVLRKKSKGKQVVNTDVFAYRRKFTHKLRRIRINSLQVRETVQESSKVLEKVVQDRQFRIDAAIVRIMKTRRSLAHSQLIAETLSQLKFPISPADVKKRIESLIDRDYIERSEHDLQVYQYIA